MDRQQYFDKRSQLQKELEALQPIDYDELSEVADLLSHFRSYWDQCERAEHPQEAQQQLLTKIVQHVFVYERNLLTVVLQGNFAVVLQENQKASGLIADALSEVLATESTVSQFGADGVGYLSGYGLLTPKKDYRRAISSLISYTLTRSSASIVSTDSPSASFPETTASPHSTVSSVKDERVGSLPSPATILPLLKLGDDPLPMAF